MINKTGRSVEHEYQYRSARKRRKRKMKTNQKWKDKCVDFSSHHTTVTCLRRSFRAFVLYIKTYLVEEHAWSSYKWQLRRKGKENIVASAKLKKEI